MSICQHIAQRAAHVPVRQLCQVLRMAPAAWYAWPRRSQEAPLEPAWQVALREAFAYRGLTTHLPGAGYGSLTGLGQGGYAALLETSEPLVHRIAVNDVGCYQLLKRQISPVA